MNAYLDLMFVNYVILTMVGFHLIKVLTCHQIGRGKIIGVSLLTGLEAILVFFIYYIALIVLIIYELIIFGIFFKKKALQYFVIHRFFQFAIAIFLSLLFEDLTIKNYILVVNGLTGELGMLVAPLIYCFISLSSLLVDNLYHLRSYKTEAMITYEGKNIFVSCYYDTGNTLRYASSPVVFLTKEAWPYEISAEEKFKALDDSKEFYGMYRSLIQIGTSKVSHFVYITIDNNVKGYNGCSCLLNAYLN